MDVRLKRAYEPATPDDGYRLLVDRLWPRGRRKADLQLAGWVRDAAPSSELRQWLHHAPERTEEFVARYRAELAARPAALEPLVAAARQGRVTLVHAGRSAPHAAVLKELIEERLGP